MNNEDLRGTLLLATTRGSAEMPEALQSNPGKINSKIITTFFPLEFLQRAHFAILGGFLCFARSWVANGVG